jgi:transketolase
MGGIANGIAYHGGFIPYDATFLTFSDYMRGSVRIAALSGLHTIYVWTHDSIGLGEDGPTHQPVEHFAALRAIPNLTFIRPGDPNEAVAAWHLAISRRDGPVALAFTRQKLPVLPGTAADAVKGVERGGYILAEAVDAEGQAADPDVILIATGSELHLAMAAREELRSEGIRARVVSLPAWDRFAAQPRAYRDAVLPPSHTKRVSIEAGVSLGWDRWVGPEGAMVALDRFGASAPAGTLFEAFGFTAAHIATSPAR